MTNGRAGPSLVYNRTSCGECAEPVKMVKLGADGLPRPTFWCSACCRRGVPFVQKAMLKATSGGDISGVHNSPRGHFDNVIFYGGGGEDERSIRAKPRKHILEKATIFHTDAKRLCTSPVGATRDRDEAANNASNRSGVTTSAFNSNICNGILGPSSAVEPPPASCRVH